ncbi:transmembrane protein 232-like [Haliotis asinina]|uniref:transmembrane protein 232-like n=1 Tax=Haliotis asinina TaxID=109174 RepID=UPI003531A90A
MPITKLPVVHKFGIISHSQRVELQERLLKQSYLQSIKSRKAIASTRNPLEISEDFVQLYNATKNIDDKERLDETARKILERAKRRAGVKDQGEGQHVNLPMAWTEMAQLAQCKGRFQEECLDILITSLDVSPLEKYHIPALFFLAETMLYWLRTEAVHQPFLRTAEIKLLRMGQLVFTRLFYHHMAGQLQGHTDFKNRLFTYLDGLQDCQEAYSPYPNALLSIRYIIEVGKIVLADAIIEPGEVKEGDRMPPRHNMDELNSATRELYEKRSRDDSHSMHSAAISSSVHDLSPTLWHALDVWRCTNHLGGGFNEALKALAHCGLGLADESWVDGMMALNILAEAAKSNMSAMKVLHRLAQGLRPSDGTQTPPLSSRSVGSEMLTISSEEETKSTKSKTSTSSKQSLSDIYERSEEGEIEKKRSHSDQSPHATDKLHDMPLDPQSTSSPTTEHQPSRPALKNTADMRLQSREVSFDDVVIHRTDEVREEKLPTTSYSSGSKLTRDTLRSNQSSMAATAGTGWRAEVGSNLPSARMSDASSVPTFTNLAMPEMAGIHGWHWEVATTYTDVLADICIHGASANIQRMAMAGINKDLLEPMRRGYTTVPLPSAGLIDLVYFKPLHEVRDGGPNDWSWRIRYGAIQSLVKICRSLAKDQNREGIRNAAWNTLIKAHSHEKDDRVLEALKVGQVHTDIESILNKQLQVQSSSIGSRIAHGLSVVYLPPLPPPGEQRPLKKSPPRKKVPLRHELGPKTSCQPLRTSLKEEIMLATALYEPTVSFNTRTTFDLRRIVEDQWRKELQTQQEEEEVERQRHLTEQQELAEQHQRQKADKKFQKLHKQDEVSPSSSDTSLASET